LLLCVYSPFYRKGTCDTDRPLGKGQNKSRGLYTVGEKKSREDKMFCSFMDVCVGGSDVGWGEDGHVCWVWCV